MGQDAGSGRFNFHRRLVGHDIDEVLIFLDHVADIHMPGDDLGLGRAFADIGKLENKNTHDQLPKVNRIAAVMRFGLMK